MDWLKDMLRQYAAGQGSAPTAVAPDPRTVEDDFDRLAQAGDPDDLTDGLAAAFRSDQTPPFPAMLAQLFERSAAPQRANILNTLLSTVGPQVVAALLGSRGVGGLFGSGGASNEVTPEMAQNIPPDVVREVAEQAEKKDPSIIDRLSRVYAEQPQLIKTLGAAALAIALAKVARRRGAL
jgi:hypothetical protein